MASEGEKTPNAMAQEEVSENRLQHVFLPRTLDMLLTELKESLGIIGMKMVKNGIYSVMSFLVVFL
jgi:hypothetical protein